MDEGTSLNDILNDTDQEPQEAAPAEQAPEPVETPEEATDGPVRDEHGRFASKAGVEDTGPPPDKLPPDEYKAIREEREKRQQLERELQAIKDQLAQPKEPPAPPPSIWDDEDAALEHRDNRVLSTAVQQATLNATLAVSESWARRTNPDFDEMKAEFLRMAENNPELAQQALADPDPWDKAYKIAKNARTMTELGATDLDSLKAKIREELEAEYAAKAPPVPGLPPTLSTERNLGTRSGPAWSGPKPLSELLG